MRHLLAILLIMATMAVAAQNLTRNVPRRSKAGHTRTVSTEMTYDTVAYPSTDSVVVSGFDKPLRAMKESMFITNNLARPIVDIIVDIEYLDMSGRQLHRATHTISEPIPSGETRMVKVPSFDTSSAFYYHLSPAPKRVAQATPFQVKVTITSVTHPLLQGL
jgi:hypothetical protein